MGTGNGAGDGLSVEFLCLSLGVISLGQGLGKLVGQQGQGRGIWGAVNRKAMGWGCWGQRVAGLCLCQTLPLFTVAGTCSQPVGSSVVNNG